MNSFQSYLVRVGGLTLSPQQARDITCSHKKNGSSSASVFEVHFIAKCGPSEQLRTEVAVYTRLAKKLGKKAKTIFPRFSFIVGEEPSVSMLLMEPIHGSTLEHEILTLGSLVAEYGPRDSKIAKKQECIAAIVKKTLELAALLHNPIAGPSALKEFVKELHEALANNLKISRLPSITPPKAWIVGNTWGGCITSMAHRDLSAVNILGTPDNVKLIDPREAVPGATRGAPFASPSIDLIELDVSLERKEMEMQVLAGARIPLKARRLVKQKIIELKRRGEINQTLIDLCYAAVYSSYTACRCDYCLSPERQWLYEAMIQKASNYSRQVR